MNVLFFLIPKIEVSYVHEDDSLRQALERMEHSGYAAVPLLSKRGRYIGTITEGDILWETKEKGFPNLRQMEDIPVSSVKRHRDNKPVKIQASMEGLLDRVINQNFVPVVDDHKNFIGMITRKDVIRYLRDKCQME